MADKKKNTFNTKLYECCSDDKLRPAFQCVHFKNGYAYATDGKIAIKQPLTFQSVVDIDELDNVSIHKDSYKAIMGFEIAQANTEGVECMNENGQQAFFEYYHPTEGEIMPDVEKMINSKKGLTSLTFIGIDPDLFIRLKRALVVPKDCEIKCQFTGISSAIIIEVTNVDEQQAILMPTVLNATLF